MMIETPATGTRGFLIYDFFKKKHVFRVYEEDKRKFTDYDLRIEDLQIEIHGNYSSLFKDEEKGENYISYPTRGKK